MTNLELHKRMRAHHMARARAATTSEEKVYHLQLAHSVRTKTLPPQRTAMFSVDEFMRPEPMNWRDARARWCARMRAAMLAQAWSDDTGIWIS